MIPSYKKLHIALSIVVMALLAFGNVMGVFAAEDEAAALEPSSTPESEFRGLWITRFEWPSKDAEKCKENIRRVMADLEAGNFNAAVFQIRGAAETLYPSELEPWSHIFDGKSPGFDPVQLAIDEAHSRGLEFYAYINPIPLVVGRRGEPVLDTIPPHLYYKHGPNSDEPWVCWDDAGNIMGKEMARKAQYFYLSPGIPAVQEYLRTVIIDVVDRYDVDGIHLDRIRYPGSKYSHDPISKCRFHCRGNPNRLDWQDWQREQLSKFVNDLYAEITAAKPDVVLSCAAWGIYNRYHIEGYYNFSSGYHDYYQDTWQWVRLGAMDLLMPMIYWDIPDPKPNYDELMKDFVEGIGGEHVVGGQRIYKLENGEDENVREVKVTRELGAQGTVMFAWGRARSRDLFSRLKDTVYSEKVPVPELSWKTNPETGIIMGTVSDEVGQPLVDAWVSLEPVDAGRRVRRQEVFRKTWTTSADGRFAFLKVPPVPVTLIVEYDGAETARMENITVEPGKIKNMKVALEGGKKAREQVAFHIFRPEDGYETEDEVVHILGRTLPNNKIIINGEHVEVYSTGAFAKDNVPLDVGENTIAISAVSPVENQTTRTLTVIRKEPIPEPEEEPTELTVEQPGENLSLLPGDVVTIKAQGPYGRKATATCWDKSVSASLNESTDEEGNPTGHYTGVYRIPAGSVHEPSPFEVQLEDDVGTLMSATSEANVEVWDATQPRVGEAVEDETGITYGTHYVRLGGPYVGEVPKGTRFEVVGKRGGEYKIRLADTLTGWVDEDNVTMLPKGTSPLHAYFTYCIIDGDETLDTLSVPINEKVVVSIRSRTQPSNCLEVDFFNTHYATTWFSHKSRARVIGKVFGEQIADGWYRLTVPITSKQIWGYWYEWDDGGLKIHVKRPPEFTDEAESVLEGLTIALEAGHGGRGYGAVGLMGTKEKTINSMAVEYVRNALEEKGAETVQMRPGDSSPRFSKRLQYAYDANADFIISIHANAAGTSRGYHRVSGTSTYYKHEHCCLPAKLIYDELLNLDWDEFGVVGNFNYMPLRQTRIPAILIEQAFMSNPMDEARLLDPHYQQQQADAVVEAMETFLERVKE